MGRGAFLGKQGQALRVIAFMVWSWSVLIETSRFENSMRVIFANIAELSCAVDLILILNSLTVINTDMASSFTSLLIRRIAVEHVHRC